jgi:nucleoside-diphosphate-sugar epimerase
MSTLVFGATGIVGGATLHALIARDTAAIAFARDAASAREQLGDSVEIRIGDLDDPATIRPALDGVDRVLICSGHDPAMRTQQLAVLDAVAASDVRRVVKISASPVAIEARHPCAPWAGRLSSSGPTRSCRTSSSKPARLGTARCPGRPASHASHSSTLATSAKSRQPR